MIYLSKFSSRHKMAVFKSDDTMAVILRDGTTFHSNLVSFADYWLIKSL